MKRLTQRSPQAIHDHQHAPPYTIKRRGASSHECKRKDAHAFLNEVVYLWYCRFQRGLVRRLQFITETPLARKTQSTNCNNHIHESRGTSSDSRDLSKTASSAATCGNGRLGGACAGYQTKRSKSHQDMERKQFEAELTSLTSMIGAEA